MKDNNNISGTDWISIVKKYNFPDPIKSWWQLGSNLLLYALGWYLMYLSLSVSYWITLALTLPSAGILVRLFIIFHDCGHGTFFRSGKLREITGRFIGILTFTPYNSWICMHQLHHETAGNLDHRGLGDVWTLTAEEYLNSTPWQRIVYRFYRNPVTMFGIGTLFVFLVGNRFTNKKMDSKGRLGVWITNAGLLLFAAGMTLLIGFKAFVLIQLPLIYVAAIMGFWLFYVQHQFNPTYWSHDENWDYKSVGLRGSSYYKLPAILHWFTGNIGYHHIHHLGPMIPNYKLRRCQRENELFQTVPPLTFLGSFKTLALRLWDEQNGEMISLRKLKSRR